MAAAIGISLLIVAAFALGLVLLGQRGAEPLFGDKIGVVEVKGVISDSRPTMEALDEFRRDDSVRAIVLRVDSPGGGVGPSQEIYQEVKRTAQAKPVVCSMGSVAASGGYYIAGPCTKIMANPGTITGSIGIISTIPNLSGLMDKLGVKLQTIKSGDLKGAGSPDRPLSEAERVMLEELNKDLYDQFLGSMAAERHLTPEQIKAINDSRVVSGRRAKDLGLVDELGNFNDAVKLAAKLGGIPGRPKLIQPQDKRDRWWGRMLKEEGRALLGHILEQAQSTGGPQYLYTPPLEGR